MDRPRRWTLCLAAVFIAIAVVPSVCRAQAERPPTIGVIDVQGVLRASAAVQSLSREVEQLRDRLEAEIHDRESALRAADVDLAERRSSLAPAAYAKERAALEEEALALQRHIQEERRRLDQRFSRGMAQIQQVLLQISQEIAQENDLDLMISKSTVIIVRSEFDFTAEALQRLNADLQEVPLPPPQN